MLPRQYRLPPTPGTRPLLTKRLPFFTAKVFPTDLAHPRFGFVVSKKVSPRAVARNRLKRQFRSSIETLLPQLRGGYDILFIVQKEALGSDSTALKASLLRFLTEAQILS